MNIPAGKHVDARNPVLSSMDRVVRSCLAAGLALALGAFVAGCASTSRPPSDLDLAKARVVQGDTATQVQLEGPFGGGRAAAAGAAKGGGAGVVVGTLACLGTGPFLPLCLGTVVPATTAVGAIGWASVDAARAASSDAVDSQRALLTTGLAAVSYPALLAGHLQQAVRTRLDVGYLSQSAADALSASNDPQPFEPAWLIKIELTAVASDARVADRAYPIGVEGRLRLYRAGRADAIYDATRTVAGESSLTTEQWAADSARAVHDELDRSLALLARGLLDDLAPLSHTSQADTNAPPLTSAHRSPANVDSP